VLRERALDFSSIAASEIKHIDQGYPGPHRGLRPLLTGVGARDHFRKEVKPSYVNVVPGRWDALGEVEFDTSEDMERAIRKLDKTDFSNPFDRLAACRWYKDDGGWW